ncbi:copper resistance protein CopC [Devosia sp.]|uniref:copper resistance CopC/CopD family protein n=1 Tax=Devosia sp. TaxID=1871048 RepID=UPI00326417AE
MQRLTLVFVLLFASVTASDAHAVLLASRPADGSSLAHLPSAVALTFSETVQPIAFSLVAPDGSTLTLSAERTAGQIMVKLPGDMAQGNFLVYWRVVSDDGHPVAGTVALSSGTADSAATVAAHSTNAVVFPLWLAIALTYLGSFFGIGGAAFCAASGGTTRLGRIYAFSMLACGALAALAVLPMQGAYMLGLPALDFFNVAAWQMPLQSSFGTKTILVLVAIAFGAASFVLPSRWSLVLALGALVAVSAAMASSGQAATAAPQWLTRPAVVLHVASLTLWVGALPFLAVRMSGRSQASLRSLLLFSQFIPYPVAVLAISGLVLAIIQLGVPGPSWFGWYSAILLGKLTLVFALLATAFVNRWLLTGPALAGFPLAAWLLRWAILVEVVLVAAIFASVALWRFTPPPRAAIAASAPPIVAHLHGDGWMGELTLARGASLHPQAVTLYFSRPGTDMPLLKSTAAMAADGTWATDGVQLSIDGVWKVRAEARSGDFDMAELSGTVRV